MLNSRLPSDQAVLIYSVGVREGGAEEWDFLWEKAHTTSVASERAMMMESLAQTQKPWLLWRYVHFVFIGGKLSKFWQGKNIKPSVFRTCILLTQNTEQVLRVSELLSVIQNSYIYGNHGNFKMELTLPEERDVAQR